jgi:phospholipid/cholesterol/gamma-HCH transport system substrate-binding protein
MTLLLVPGPVRAIGRATRLRLLGVVFVAVCFALLALAVLVYQKAFTPVVKVKLRADSIGNQLVVPADVKLRGIVVGEVRAVHSGGRLATLDLALDPDHVRQIPANVQARILPKTLFGEKFVDLVLPRHPAPEHIAAGDVIPQDRSRNAIELQRVFDDVLPLLRTLKPAALNETLSALSNALEGRGEELGHNVVLADRYFSGINPHLPTIEADISGIADLASNLNDAAPDLLSMARNFSVSSRTVVQKQQTLARFLTETQGFAGTTTRFLQANANRLITLGAVSRPTLAVLASYSSEYPCLLQGLTSAEQRLEPVFGPGPYLHIALQVVNSRGGYQQGKDNPDYHHFSPASCDGLPQQGPPTPPSDGGPSTPSLPQLPPVPGDVGPVGTAAEQHVVAALVGPALGSGGEGAGLADLLMGPMMRGTAVSQR